MEPLDIIQLETEFVQARSSLVTDRIDMSFGEIMNIYQDGDIIISPEFQRLFRWSNYQKTRFIESVLLGIPIPPIFVSEDLDGKWELVDGLQRVSTILSFFGILKKGVSEMDEKNNWKFTRGDIINSLEGMSREDLPLKLQIAIKRAVCRVELLRYNQNNQDLKYELFNRLNTGGSTATEQEIRNCIFRGTSDKFNNFLKELAQNKSLFNLVLPSKQQIDELYLEEIVLRFISLYYADETYDLSQNISRFMTLFMKRNVSNSNFDYEGAKNIFTRLMDLLERLNDDKIFRAVKGPFSTNIFDIITVGVSEHITFYEEKPIEVLASKIQSLKESDLHVSTTSSKVSSSKRNEKRLELGKSFFKP